MRSLMLVLALLATVCAFGQSAAGDRRVTPIEPASQDSSGFGAYSYDGSGNIVAVGNDAFTYDRNGRIGSATVAGTAQTFTYDRHGNLTNIGTSGETARPLPVVAHTNRISGATYDASGNLLSYHGGTFVYDGPNVVTEHTPIDGNRHLYLYNASNERIATIEVLPGNQTRTDWTLRDPSGKVLRRLRQHPNGAWSWKEDYIYAGRQLLAAEVPTSEKVRHFFLDHLGTPRLITGNGGAALAERAYSAFGRAFTVTSTQQVTSEPNEPAQFTGHERDDFQLDYMHARYYDPLMGRFLSVDRTISKESLRRPQMWNRYSYVANNPVKFTDPDGNEIRLTGCIQDAHSQACKDQTSIARQAFGKAWQYVNDDNGVLTLKAGVSPAMLGARFGVATRALAFMANSKDTFSLITGAVAAAMARDFGGARTIAASNGGANIYIDPSRFPRTLGGASMGAAEAYAHETGHAIAPYFANISGINARYAGSGEVAFRGEVFPVFLENAWRRQTLGLPSNDVRVFYKEGGDIRYPGTKLEEIWP